MSQTHEHDYQFVYFHLYCKKCKHWLKDALKEPCHHCLDNPVNLQSHKPVNFEEAQER